MRAILILSLLALASGANAEQPAGKSPFLAFSADSAAPRPVQKDKLELVLATPASRFTEIRSSGANRSRLAECTIPQPLPAGPSRGDK